MFPAVGVGIALVAAAIMLTLEFRPGVRTPLHPYVIVWLVIWCLLLIPWCLFAGLAGMAFDGGYTASAYAFAWSIWTYPISLAIAFLCRRRFPALVVLPLIHFIAVAF